MTEKPRQHKRFGRKKHEHRNFYAKFSKADENLKEQAAREARLRKQAEDRGRDSTSYTPGYGYGAGGGRNWYSSLSDYTLREIPIFHLPYERFQARSALDFI
jgi:hypothetical protein